MRFSLFELLLIAPAWAIAFVGCSASPWSRTLVSHRHVNTINDLRGIRMVLYSRYGSNASIDDVDRMQLAIDVDGLNDPWGNDYCLIEKHVPNAEMPDFKIHVYSLGEDADSKTTGDDPDDLNTWSIDVGRHYWTRIDREIRRKRAVQATIATPVVFPMLIALSRLLARNRKTRDDDDPSAASNSETDTG